ncbi:MAG: aminotransferase class V-fold PLP-dependent enzyme [Bacteroidota bacterium]|nr:aminotransferase class V-fold PLP-dependent enzyme [Bacteroidota bacterium]
MQSKALATPHSLNKSVGNGVRQDSICELESRARALELTGPQWEELASKVLAYAWAHVSTVRDQPAYNAKPGNGINLLSSPIAEHGISIDDALDLLHDNVDTVSLNPGSPRFLGYIPAGGLVHSAFGDFLAAIANRYAGIFFGSPGAVRMENLLVRWMAEVAGFPANSGGFLSAGGSTANLSAIVTAREACHVLADDATKVVVYVTEHTHHCVDKGLRIAGLGHCRQHRIAVDDRARMCPENLDTRIRKDREAGLRPWLLVASAGTTNTGTVDPLRSLNEVARAHNLWYHIDGAYGAFFALCPEGEAVLDGMGLADSLVLDPHKTLFLPYGTGALLVRDRELMARAHGGMGAYMLDMETDPTEPSPAYLSPELTKHFRGLRMWLPLKLLGLAPFRAALSEKIHLARYFHSQIQQIRGFEVGPTPDLSIVTYRYVPSHGDADAFNRRMVKELQRDGRVFITSTRVGGRTVLRMAVGCFRTHREDIDLALNLLEDKARRLENK